MSLSDKELVEVQSSSSWDPEIELGWDPEIELA